MDNKKIERRTFLTGAAVTAATAGAGFPAPAIATGKRQWKMVMTWQKTLPGLGTGAVRLAKRIEAMSEGMIEIKVHGGGELVPPLQTFDAVSQGTAQIGHGAAYYWLNKNKSCAFFTAVPSGLTAQEMNAWIYFGGGQKLWDELYAPFKVKAFPAGNTGTQMGGWFNRKINSVDDLKGLKMRIPGLGGEVLNRLGGSAQVIPAQELYTSIQSGLIDALEWVGPWNDTSLGFQKVAKYYYGPGFHEGGAMLECIVNKDEYNSLSKHLQNVVKTACATENVLMASQYLTNNLLAFNRLKKESEVEILSFPKDVRKALYKTSEQVVAETASLGDINKRIYESYSKFRQYAIDMGYVSEQGYMNDRALL